MILPSCSVHQGLAVRLLSPQGTKAHPSSGCCSGSGLHGARRLSRRTLRTAALEGRIFNLTVSQAPQSSIAAKHKASQTA